MHPEHLGRTLRSIDPPARPLQNAQDVVASNLFRG